MTTQPSPHRRTTKLARLAGVVLAVILAVSFVAVRPAGATVRAQPILLTMASQQPETIVRVIVQKSQHNAEAEALVSSLGGTVLNDLSIINGFIAALPGKHIPTLAQAAGVRWVSLDAAMVKNTCAGCVDTSQATSAWLQTTKAKELWSRQPGTQGQGVTVAVIDSGIVENDDLRSSDGTSRVITNVAFSKSMSALNTVEAESYTATSGTVSYGMMVGQFDHGDWLQYNNIDFGSGVTTFQANVSTQTQWIGQEIELRLDSPTGPLIGALKVQDTTNWMKFRLQSTPVSGATGMRNLFLVGKGIGLASSIDWFSFTNSTTGIDDFTKGTGQNQFNYVGNWGSNYDSNGSPFQNTNSWSRNPNDYVTFAFNGTQIELYGVKGLNHGIGAVSIDGGSETMVDFYGTRQGNALIWTSPTLSVGNHTLKLRVTGTKHPSSSDSYVVPDRIDIISKNLHNKIEAETYDAMQGVSDGDTVIGYYEPGDWLQYNNIDFGNGGMSLLANVAVPSYFAGQKIEVRLDSLTGPVVGTLTVQSTGSWDTYTTQSVPLVGATGIRTMYLIAKGNLAVANIDWLRLANVTDQYGHGTHVAGLIGGNGKASGGLMVGMAPQSKLINIRVNGADGSAMAGDVIAGLQWVNENRAKYNIKVVNVSLNSKVPEAYDESALNTAVEILWFNGVTVIASAGNNGNDGKLYPPANDPFVITVGATDDKGTADRNDDTIATFSARGTTGNNVVKPELVAPGVNVTSLNCSACTLAKNYPGNVASGFTGSQQYFRASGTSMSAAIVSGAAALIIQQNPSLTPDQVKYRLLESGYHSQFGNWPRYLNVSGAVTSGATASSNTGVIATRMLWTGANPLTWGSANWNSANWNSANWNSANWNSTVLDASAANQVGPSIYLGK